MNIKKSALVISLAIASITASSAQSIVPSSGRVLFENPELKPHPAKKGKYYRPADKWGVQKYRIPDLFITAEGHLGLVVTCRCSLGGHDNGRSTAFITISKDKGNTWEYIRNSTDYKNPDKRPTTDFPMTERTNESQVIWWPAKNQYVASYLDKSVIWFTTSKDLRSWTNPVKATFDGDDEFKAPGSYWPSPTSLIVDTDGSLMIAVPCKILKEGGERPSKKSPARLLRTNDLKNFEVSPPMSCNGNETAFCQIGDGKYFVTTRMRRRSNMIYDSKARSWSEPSLFPKDAYGICAADLINDNGSLYLTTPNFCNIKISTMQDGRIDGALYKSTDDGKTWVNILQLNKGKFAYSSIIKIDKHTLGVVYEEADKMVFVKVDLRKK